MKPVAITPPPRQNIPKSTHHFWDQPAPTINHPVTYHIPFYLCFAESSRRVNGECSMTGKFPGKNKLFIDGWMNQAYSRLSTTHGHITDCKLLVCTYWTRLVLVRPAASLYSASPMKHYRTGEQ